MIQLINYLELGLITFLLNVSGLFVVSLVFFSFKKRTFCFSSSYVKLSQHITYGTCTISETF